MSNYEWASTVISFLSLIATIFFGWQVYRMSKKANAIATEALSIQKEVSNSSKTLIHRYDKEEENDEKLEELSKFEDNTSELKKSVKEIKRKTQYEDYKIWKQENIESMKEFLKLLLTFLSKLITLNFDLK